MSYFGSVNFEHDSFVPMPQRSRLPMQTKSKQNGSRAAEGENEQDAHAASGEGFSRSILVRKVHGQDAHAALV
jgi:hypothetical protein